MPGCSSVARSPRPRLRPPQHTFTHHVPPTSAGAKDAAVDTAKQRRDENPTTFSLAGTGCPEINVRQRPLTLPTGTGSHRSAASCWERELRDRLHGRQPRDFGLNLTGTRRSQSAARIRNVPVERNPRHLFRPGQQHVHDHLHPSSRGRRRHGDDRHRRRGTRPLPFSLTGTGIARDQPYGREVPTSLMVRHYAYGRSGGKRERARSPHVDNLGNSDLHLRAPRR